jgi:hypothetical protein
MSREGRTGNNSCKPKRGRTIALNTGCDKPGELNKPEGPCA